MDEERFDITKQGILHFIQGMFEEMEEDMAMSHQEKYALLEDAFENATDMDELRVAFEQWYNDHSEDLDFEHELDELWEMAMAHADE